MIREAMTKVYYFAWIAVLILVIVVLTKSIGLELSLGESVGENNKVISNALEKLENYKKNYYVTTIIDTNNSNTNYIEFNLKNGVSYTEYPIQSDGSVGDILSEDIVGYSMSDWITDDGKMYMVNQYTDSSDTVYDSTMKLPDSFAEYCKSRRVFYLDKVIDYLHDYKEKSDVTMDFGDGDESVSMYECTLDGEHVRDMLNVDSYVLFSKIAEEYKDNKNIAKFCKYYLDDVEKDLTYSDAKVTIGIASKKIVYMQLEVGGLGQRLYLTRVFTKMGSDMKPSDTPNFDDSKDYVKEKIQDDADYIASFDSAEDAIKALNVELYNMPEPDNVNDDGMEKIEQKEEAVSDEENE